MREFLKRLGVVGAAVLFATAAACGGGEDAEEVDGGDGEEAAPAVHPDSAATISGVVNFEGTPPAAEPIDMSEEPACAEKYSEPPTREAVVANDGRLANVYVYVKEGLPDREWPTASESVTLDQDGCHYIPHVTAIQVGQPLDIVNSDGILHNINTQPTVNRGFNISQPVEMTTTRDFSAAEVMIPVKCDVHGWMEAYIGVQEHPYAVVSGDDGSFTIENLPAGTYTVEAWHELYGTQTTTVTVAAQETGEATFTYSADMAGRPVPLGEPIDLHDHGDTRVASAH
ncbi:MAG TPA: carboxypeptidase regulatory-like domain-containing protein [Gemmatimonadota bacterium]|nr:carboxypeptidase regulatory-like domain-containing protein [Gemmatimonadota bacterium]